MDSEYKNVRAPVSDQARAVRVNACLNIEEIEVVEDAAEVRTAEGIAEVENLGSTTAPSLVPIRTC